MDDEGRDLFKDLIESILWELMGPLTALTRSVDVVSKGEGVAELLCAAGRGRLIRCRSFVGSGPKMAATLDSASQCVFSSIVGSESRCTQSLPFGWHGQGFVSRTILFLTTRLQGHEKANQNPADASVHASTFVTLFSALDNDLHPGASLRSGQQTVQTQRVLAYGFNISVLYKTPSPSILLLASRLYYDLTLHDTLDDWSSWRIPEIVASECLKIYAI